MRLHYHINITLPTAITKEELTVIATSNGYGNIQETCWPTKITHGCWPQVNAQVEYEIRFKNVYRVQMTLHMRLHHALVSKYQEKCLRRKMHSFCMLKNTMAQDLQTDNVRLRNDVMCNVLSEHAQSSINRYVISTYTIWQHTWNISTIINISARLVRGSIFRHHELHEHMAECMRSFSTLKVVSEISTTCKMEWTVTLQ